jgi:hypothetical protein
MLRQMDEPQNQFSNRFTKTRPFRRAKEYAAAIF